MLRGFVTVQVLAAFLGIADLLASEPRSVSELAAATGAHQPLLHCSPRMLTGPGVLREEADDRFAITRLDIVLRPGMIRARPSRLTSRCFSPSLLIRAEDEFRQRFTAAGQRLTT